MKETKEHSERTLSEKSSDDGGKTVEELHVESKRDYKMRLRYDIFLLVAGIILLLVLIYTIRDILSPFLLAGAISFLLYPLRKYEFAKTIIALSVVLFALWLLYTIRGILVPFIIALIFAYIFAPLVSLLEKRKIPRWISALAVLLFLIGVIVLIGIYGFPNIISQFEKIIGSISDLVSEVKLWVASGEPTKFLEQYGIPAESVNRFLTTEMIPRLEQILKEVLTSIFSVFTGASSVLASLVDVVVIPFLLFYFLKDWAEIRHRCKHLIPLQHRPSAVSFVRKVDGIIGAYLRGAVPVALINGTMVSTLLWVFGFEYPLVLGIISAVLDLIPYFGVIITTAVCIVVTLFNPPPVLPKIILVVVIFGAVKIVEDYVFLPRIIGSRIGIHPIVLILCLLVFAYFLGFVGMLIAMPTTGILLMLLREYEQRRDRLDARQSYS
jgi:predicted PurR-regulated permease PerM